MGLRVCKLETSLGRTQKSSKEQRKIIHFYCISESQERKEPCILSYLVHYDESTSIDNYDDEFQVVVMSGVKQSGNGEVFLEEVLCLSGIQAPMHSLLMIICIMSKAGLKSYRKV